jgi:hypothetical protein
MPLQAIRASAECLLTTRVPAGDRITGGVRADTQKARGWRGGRVTGISMWLEWLVRRAPCWYFRMVRMPSTSKLSATVVCDGCRDR